MGILSGLTDRAASTARSIGSAAGYVASEAVGGFEDRLEKARGLTALKSKKIDQVAGPPADPFGIIEWTEEQAQGYGGVGLVNPLFSDKPGPANLLSYAMLDAFARQPIIGSIIGTRVNEIGELARPQPNKYSLGYRIRVREIRRKPRGLEIKEAERLERFIERCGSYDDIDLAMHHTFEAFLRMTVRQTYTYDQVAFEVQRDPLGRPAGFQSYDTTTIRRALKSSSPLVANNVDVVQVWRNSIIAGWPANDFCFGVRRPRASLAAMGYGYPEAEELVNTMKYLLWAEDYNAAAFRQGALAEGVLQIIGDMPRKQMRGLRRQFKAMLTGVQNAAKLAVINLPATTGKEKVDLLRFKQSNREMEFREWINFLLKIICAIYAIDPAQIGFVFGNEGVTSELSGRGPMERVQISKDKGLRPLLRFLEYLINVWILWPLNPDFSFEFVGLDSISEADKADLDAKAVKTHKTVDEIRAEHDDEPLPDGEGEVILDPAWMQMHQAAQMPDEGFGGEFGDDGGGGGEPPGFDKDNGGDNDKDNGGDKIGKDGGKPKPGQPGKETGDGPPAPPKSPSPSKPLGGAPLKKGMQPRTIWEVRVDYEDEGEDGTEDEDQTAAA